MRDEEAELRRFEEKTYAWSHRAAKMGFGFARTAKGSTSMGTSHEGSPRRTYYDSTPERTSCDSRLTKRVSVMMNNKMIAG